MHQWQNVPKDIEVAEKKKKKKKFHRDDYKYQEVQRADQRLNKANKAGWQGENVLDIDLLLKF